MRIKHGIKVWRKEEKRTDTAIHGVKFDKKGNVVK